MTTSTRIRTDYVHRYHLHIDPEAAQFTAFKVELLGVETVVIMEDGGTIEGLWAQALAQMSVLRGQVGPPVFPPSDFQPYATITAVDAADVHRALVVRNARIVGDGHPDHDQRVSALCRAADLVGLGGMSPPAGVERH